MTHEKRFYWCKEQKSYDPLVTPLNSTFWKSKKSTPTLLMQTIGFVFFLESMWILSTCSLTEIPHASMDKITVWIITCIFIYLEGETGNIKWKHKLSTYIISSRCSHQSYFTDIFRLWYEQLTEPYKVLHLKQQISQASIFTSTMHVQVTGIWTNCAIFWDHKTTNSIPF